MKSFKGFLIVWVSFFIVIGIFSFFNYADGTITGNIPLTGILKEGTGESVSFPEVNISFFMKEKDIYKIRDIEYSLNFIPKTDVRTTIGLSYIVTDDSGNIQFYDEESLVIQGETFIEDNLDRRKAQDIKLPEGEYTFSLRISYGNSEKTFSDKFQSIEIPEWLYSLKQLFDIKMEIDETILDDSSDLEARVIFESFGSEPTSVDLTFFIYDMNDNEILRKTKDTVIETEGVIFESFEEFEEGPGEYRVVLRTVYNVDVEDYFEQKIIIRDKLDVLPFFIAGGILLAGVLIFLFLKRRK